MVCWHLSRSCCWYHKGTNFQANHNRSTSFWILSYVVADTTKVRIFKQITTNDTVNKWYVVLLLIPQRYEFSSKSQPNAGVGSLINRCCWYHKGTNFQANHNTWWHLLSSRYVVADTTKVRIFKQITTENMLNGKSDWLLLIPQRYEFSSKSQRSYEGYHLSRSCCWYHKGTNFQANHNLWQQRLCRQHVVADTTKVRIFKQITTLTRYTLLLHGCCWYHKGTNFQANHNEQTKAITRQWLLLIPQRYEFSSKSQLIACIPSLPAGCCWYHKGTNFQANHNTCTS